MNQADATLSNDNVKMVRSSSQTASNPCDSPPPSPRRESSEQLLLKNPPPLPDGGMDDNLDRNYFCLPILTNKTPAVAMKWCCIRPRLCSSRRRMWYAPKITPASTPMQMPKVSFSDWLLSIGYVIGWDNALFSCASVICASSLVSSYKRSRRILWQRAATRYIVYARLSSWTPRRALSWLRHETALSTTISKLSKGYGATFQLLARSQWCSSECHYLARLAPPYGVSLYE